MNGFREVKSMFSRKSCKDKSCKYKWLIPSSDSQEEVYYKWLEPLARQKSQELWRAPDNGILPSQPLGIQHFGYDKGKVSTMRHV